MALSHADRSVTDVAAQAVGAPVWLGKNQLESVSAARWDADGDMSAGSDITATGYPVTRAYDYQLDTYTKPNAAAADQYFCLDFGATGINFDAFVMVWSVVAGSIDTGTDGGYIYFECDDAVGYGTKHLLAAIEGAGSSDPFLRESDRIVDLNLLTANDPQAFTGVRYVRVHFHGSATLVPAIHEFWLGTQYQLPRRPVYPANPDRYRTVFAENESDGGRRTRYLKQAGIWVHNARLQLTSTTERAALSAWRGATSFERRPVWIIENPTSVYSVGPLNGEALSCPRARLCLLDADELPITDAEPGLWELEIQATETGDRTLYAEEGTIP